MKKFFCIVFLLTGIQAFSACALAEGSVQFLSTNELSVASAPDVRGAGSFLKRDSLMFRLRGGFSKGETGSMGHRKVENKAAPTVCGDVGKCSASQRMQILEEAKNVDVSYRVERDLFYGMFDLTKKFRTFFLNAAVGYDAGLFHSFELGVNYEHFEAGTFVFMRFAGIESRYGIKRYSCYCDGGSNCHFSEDASLDEVDDISLQLGFGVSAAVYFGRYSLGYSLSFYEFSHPEYNDVRTKLDLPWVVTSRLGLGALVARHLELRTGVVNVAAGFDESLWAGFAELGLRI